MILLYSFLTTNFFDILIVFFYSAAIHIAAEKNNLEIAKMLLNYPGIDVNVIFIL